MSYNVKCLHITFDKVDEYIRRYDRNTIRPYFHQLINMKEYLIELESVTAISDVYMKINSDNGLPLKILNIRNVLKFVKSAFNNDYNHYDLQLF